MLDASDGRAATLAALLTGGPAMAATTADRPFLATMIVELSTALGVGLTELAVMLEALPEQNA
ncbi:MAG: hypothetical protein EOP19_09950 [Hyphomicrobiales bacterium]|nr:MAG: hypothetical protein EOP19_09950 [Hyphomicrobiales bacterium]